MTPGFVDISPSIYLRYMYIKQNSIYLRQNANDVDAISAVFIYVLKENKF